MKQQVSGKTFLIVSVACVLAVCLIGGSFTRAGGAPKKYELEYRLKKSAKLTMATSTQRKSVRSVMGNETITNAEDMIEYGIEVQEPKDGSMMLELEFKNRTHKSDDPQFQVPPDFSGLIGQKAKVSLSAKGKLTSFDGFEALPEIELTYSQTTLGKDRYINELRDFFVVLPEEPTEIGGTWSYTEEYEEPVEGGAAKVVVDYTFTLSEEIKKGGHDCVKLDGKFTTKVTGKGEAQGIVFALRFKGEGQGTAYFAYKKGMFLEVETTSFVEGAAVAEEVGLEMPMRHDYETKRTYSFGK